MWSKLVGTTLDGRLELERLLGTGGFGAVFLAQDKVRGTVIRRLAVKLVPVNAVLVDSQINELKSALNLDHPCIIRSYGVGEAKVFLGAAEREVLHISMEVAGQSLLDRVRSVPLSADETTEVAFDIASALLYLHSKRSIHRDVKPGNILRVGSRWKLSDFGLVRYLGASRSADGPPAGTLRYMAPEASDGEQSSASDIWSLGMTLAHAHTGRFPFAGQDREFIRAIQEDDPDLADDLPYPLGAIILGCLNKDPSRRLIAHQVLELLEDAGFKSANQRLRTIVVSIDGSGDYRSIAEALSDANRGDRVLVKPGIYKEAIVIDRHVELVGDGKPDEVIIESVGRPAVFLQARRAALRGLTLSSTRGTEPTAVGDAALMIVRGRPVVEACVVRSRLPAGITVRGAATSPLILKCLVWDVQTCGVFVYDRARPIIEECVIKESARVGLWASDGGDPLVRGSEISGSGTRGVLIAESARGTFDRCRVVDSHGPGVEIAGKAAPLFQCCVISGNQGVGIAASSGAGGVVRECNLQGNADGAWSTQGRESVVWLANDPAMKRG